MNFRKEKWRKPNKTKGKGRESPHLKACIVQHAWTPDPCLA